MGERAQLRFLVRNKPLFLCAQEASPSSGIPDPAEPKAGPRSSTESPAKVIHLFVFRHITF